MEVFMPLLITVNVLGFVLILIFLGVLERRLPRILERMQELLKAKGKEWAREGAADMLLLAALAGHPGLVLLDRVA